MALPPTVSEEARTQAVAAYEILDSLPEAEFDDLAALAATVCETPMAVITFLDEHRQWFKARVGVGVQETPRSIAFCDHTVRGGELLLVADSLEDHRFRANPFVTGEPYIRFYAGAPLLTANGVAIGSLAVIDRRPRQLTPSQLDALRTMARLVMERLEARLRRLQLERSRAEQARAEAALREGEAGYRSLFEANPHPMWIYDLETLRFLAVNEVAVTRYGYSREEFLRLTLRDIRPPEDVERLHQNVAASPAGVNVSGVWRHRLRDGTVILVEITSHPLTYNGRAARAVLAHDVTRRLQAEDALRESEERFRRSSEELARIFDASLDIICAIDRDGRFLRVSAAAGPITGYAPEELVGTHYHDFLLPEDRPQTEAVVAEVMAGRALSDFRNRWRHRDGSTVHLTWSARWSEPHAILLAVGRDITQAHRAEEAVRVSEERAKLVARATSDAIWDWDMEAGTLWWNDGYTRLFGFDAASHAPSFEAWTQLVHPEDRARVLAVVEQALARGEDAWSNEYRFRRHDGSYAYVLDRGLAVRGPDGTPRRMVGGMTDFTERREAELELARTNRALQMLSACNEALIRATDEQQLLREICQLTVDIGGYAFAWVGYLQDDEAQTLQPVSRAGSGEGYLEEITLELAPGRRGAGGPADRALRSGEPSVHPDLAADSPWPDAARRLGFRSLICLPLREHDRSFGLLALYTRQVAEIGAEEIKLLRELADDLAFGISNLRAQLARQRLEATVLKVAAGVSASTGQEFFQNLARHTAEAVGARAAFVFQRTGDTTARVVAGTIDGAAAPEFDLDLGAHPTPDLFGGDEWILARGASAALAGCPPLAALHAEGAVGHPLADSHGAVAGLLLVLFPAPLPDPSFIVSTLQIFAARAAAELERQQADARIREQASLLNQARDAILVRDLEHRVRYWNEGAERLYGWPAAEVLGQSITTLVYTDTAPFLRAFDEVLRTGAWVGELHQVNRQGRPLVIEARWTLMRDAAGLPRSILAINTDVTERKQLEQQFLRAQRLESIGTLAGGIAHDLNNMLTPISVAVDLLRFEVHDADSITLLDTIATSAKRGASMVAQVLSFARGVEGQRVEVQAERLVDDLRKIVRDTFPKNIDLRVQIGEGPHRLIGDPTQLHQVLLNLCVNARDALPRGGTLELAVEQLDVDPAMAAVNIGAKPGPHVVLHVSDSGVGMSPETLEKIYDPFFTTKEVGKGTGLGLSTTLAIVKSHGGFIRVQSAPGRGTRFSVHLPAASGAGKIAAPPEPARPPRGRGETILVVDDESSIRLMAEQTLSAFGYQILVAADGAEAVARYAQHRERVALVFTDMMMPVMDGTAAIEALRQLNPRVRIVAASGVHAAQVSPTAGSAEGVLAFLRKPYSAVDLLRTVRQALDAPRE